MRPLSKIGILFVALATLSGCGSDDGMNSLRSYANKVKSRPARPIEPLPEVRPYQSFMYSAAELRSPFVPPVPEATIEDIIVGNGIHPDKERRKEILENYPLDTLRMVGTLERTGDTWAVILDSDGMVHRIAKGNYIGQNHGKVTGISEEGIEINEIVPDSRGGWQERAASMALTEE